MTIRKSWIESANSAETDFPLNNLPYGVFWLPNAEQLWDIPHCGVAIGDMILDVTALEGEYFEYSPEPVFDTACWNEFMELGPDIWGEFRSKLIELLKEGSTFQDEIKPHLHPMAEAQLELPLAVSEYTDFYAGRQHAENMGAILRGSPDLPANWLHIPIGYNGRASSVVVSGTPIRRPLGQRKAPDAAMPSFGPCLRLDIELEMGAIVGTGSEMGTPISTAQADDMIFGYVLLNDWSARDIQGWEYQPLGPFQGKAFGTSISPWIVTKDALEPFRAATPPREKELLPYLAEDKPGLYDIDLEVWMQPEGAERASRIAKTNYARMYYSAAQQLTHHAVGGCGMNTGDLLGSGTISGPEKGEYGSLMELSWNAKEPLTLDTGESRTFLEDGDTMTLRGHANGDGYRIGFGDCTGKILPAAPLPAWAKD